MSSIIDNSLPLLLDQISDPAAQDIITARLIDFDVFDWDRIFTKPINTIKNEQSAGQPIKILARVASITDTFPLQIDKERFSVVEITLADKDGNEISCTRMVYSPSLDLVFQLFEKQKLAVFGGTVLSDIENENYLFLPYKIDEIVRAEDLIYVKTEPDFNVNLTDLLMSLQFEGKIFSFIKTTLVKQLNIKGLQSATRIFVSRFARIVPVRNCGGRETGSLKCKTNSLFKT